MTDDTYSDDAIPTEGAAAPSGEPGDATSEAIIARLEAEVTQWKDQALRAAAEAENTRRRAEREANDARAYAIQRFAKDLLNVADNLARANQAAPRDATDPAIAGFVTGVEMTERELLSVFERNGLKRLDPKPGDKFDPNLHQAMMEQPSEEHPAGAVIATLAAGYELFGRIVRPAMVAVAAKGSGKPQEPENPAAAAGASAYAHAADTGEQGGAFDTKA